jgi:hypothetical protein
VVSFTTRSLYPRGRSPRYPLDRGLGVGLQSLSGRYEEEKHLTPTGNRTPAVQPMASRYTDSWTKILFIFNFMWTVRSTLTEQPQCVSFMTNETVFVKKFAKFFIYLFFTLMSYSVNRKRCVKCTVRSLVCNFRAATARGIELHVPLIFLY